MTEWLSTAQTAETYDLTILEAGKVQDQAITRLGPSGLCEGDPVKTLSTSLSFWWLLAILVVSYRSIAQISPFLFTWPVCISVSKGPPFHQDTSYTVLGPNLMASLYLCKKSNSKRSYSDVLGFRTHHIFWGRIQPNLSSNQPCMSGSGAWTPLRLDPSPPRIPNFSLLWKLKLCGSGTSPHQHVSFH